MKKNVKRKALTLATETVAILTNTQRDAIAGGASAACTASHVSVCHPCKTDLC